LAELPGKTYIGTSSTSVKGADPSVTGAMSIITVPSGSAADEFFNIVVKKMEPLWANRSAFRVDNGTAIELDNGDWRVRLGDLRITAGQGQGRIRGVLVQVETNQDDDEDELDEDKSAPTNWDIYEPMLQAFFEATFRGADISMEGLRHVVRIPEIGIKDSLQLVLVRQYMEMLRFARVSQGAA